jgi:hypothetical protein
MLQDFSRLATSTRPAAFPAPCRRPAGAGVGPKSSALATVILTLNLLCLWYYCAGGIFATTLLGGIAVISLLTVPFRESSAVIRENWVALLGCGVLSVVSFMLFRTKTTFEVFLVLALFGVGCGSVLRLLVSQARGVDRAFMLIVLLVAAFAGWGAYYATAIMPQNQIITGDINASNQEVERILQLFHVGNNYYTITYFLAVPMVAIGLLFIEVRSRLIQFVLLGSAVTACVLAIVFERRGPIWSAAITFLVMLPLAYRNRRGAKDIGITIAGLSLVAGAAGVWLLSREWGADVINRFMLRNQELLEDARFSLWIDSLRWTLLNPLGNGRASFQNVSMYAHNAILDGGLDLGIPGALAMGSLWLQAAWTCARRIIRRVEDIGPLEAILFAIAISHLLMVLQEPVLNERWIVLLWAAISLRYASPVIRDGRRAPRAFPVRLQVG